jgi:hypothetical protein
LLQTWTETYNNLYIIIQSPQTFPLYSPPLPAFSCLVKCEFHFPFRSFFFCMSHFFFNSPLHFKQLEDTGGGMDTHLLRSCRDYRPNLIEHEEFILCLKMLSPSFFFEDIFALSFGHRDKKDSSSSSRRWTS